MNPSRDVLLCGLFGVHVAVFSVFFAVAGGSLLTLVAGANIGAGLTGVGL